MNGASLVRLVTYRAQQKVHVVSDARDVVTLEWSLELMRDGQE